MQKMLLSTQTHSTESITKKTIRPKDIPKIYVESALMLFGENKDFLTTVLYLHESGMDFDLAFEVANIADMQK